jgi:hypothetical protein
MGKIEGFVGLDFKSAQRQSAQAGPNACKPLTAIEVKISHSVWFLLSSL